MHCWVKSSLGTRAWLASDRVKSKDYLHDRKGKFQYATIDEFDGFRPSLSAVNVTNFGKSIDRCCGSSISFNKRLGNSAVAFMYTPAIILASLFVVATWKESRVSIK